MKKIISTKSVLSGKPRISGTRISVDLIAHYIYSGYGVAEIKKNYPHLTREEITSALDYMEKQACKERMKLEPKTS